MYLLVNTHSRSYPVTYPEYNNVVPAQPRATAANTMTGLNPGRGCHADPATRPTATRRVAPNPVSSMVDFFLARLYAIPRAFSATDRLCDESSVAQKSSSGIADAERREGVEASKPVVTPNPSIVGGGDLATERECRTSRIASSPKWSEYEKE